LKLLDLCGALFLIGIVLGAGTGMLCSDHGYRYQKEIWDRERKQNEKKTKRN